MFGNVIFEPPFPAPVVILIAAGLAVVAVALYAVTRRGGPRTRTVLGILRLLAVLGMAMVLLRPMTVKPTLEAKDKPVFAVLVDTSASMNTRDVNDGPRFAEVRDKLERAAPMLANELGRRCEVAYCEFSDGVTPTTPTQLVGKANAAGPQTDIGTALTRAVDLWPGRRWAGMLVVSDGRENAGMGADRAAAHLKTLGVPVWASVVGTENQAKDVFATAWLSQNFLFVKQPGFVRASVTQTGYPDQYAKVNLYREGQYVGSQQILFRSGAARLDFPVREEASGTYQYQVEVEPLEGEADLRNNRRTVFARVVDEKSRVLVVEGEPSWDTKFMLRALRSDPNLDITSLFYVTRTRPFVIQDKPAQGLAERDTLPARMPQNLDEMGRYDCIVFGRDVDALLSADDLKRVRQYLNERGGSVVFARGKAYEGEDPDLATLEPMLWGDDVIQGGRFELTPEGRSHPAFTFEQGKPSDAIIRELPEMTSITTVQKEKSLSVILAKTTPDETPQEMAVVAYQRYGKGKVMSIGASGMWRWSLLPDKYAQYEEVYARFWGQMMRWLLAESDFLPGQDITFRVDKHTHNLGEPVRLSVWTRNVDLKAYRPTISVVPENGQPLTLTPAQDGEEGSPFVATFTPETEGDFTAILSNNVGAPKQDTLRFAVYSDNVETRLVAADPDLLDSVATTTGGCLIPINDLARLPGEVKKFEESVRQRTKAVDIWDRPSVFAALAGLLCVEWFLRRRRGLV